MRFLFAWQHVTAASRLTGADGLRAVLGHARRLRAGGRRLGTRGAAGAGRSIRAVDARPAVPDRRGRLGAAVDPDAARRRAGAPQLGWAARRRSRCSFASTAAPGTPCGASEPSGAGAATSSSTSRAPAGAGGAARLAARRSRATSRAPATSTRAASAPRSANWSAPGWSPRTASPDCARSSAPSGGRPVAAATAATRVRPADGRCSTRRCRASRDEAIEAQARSLLRRYGVVFRRLLAREATAVTWRELTRVYRRLEARGEIRGGRFVSGMSGEQFALPDAVARLREVRRTAADGRLVTLSRRRSPEPDRRSSPPASGCGPSPAAGSSIRDGIPLAALEGDYLRPLTPARGAAAGRRRQRAGRPPAAGDRRRLRRPRRSALTA